MKAILHWVPLGAVLFLLFISFNPLTNKNYVREEKFILNRQQRKPRSIKTSRLLVCAGINKY